MPDPRNTASAAANLMPTVTVPDTLWTPDDTALAISGITVADPDAGTSPLEITLDADQGTLTLGMTTGLTFTDGDGTADASMTFTGSLTDIGTALAGLTYTPETGYHGAGGISVWADDQGNTGAGGSLVDFGVLTVAVGGQVVAVDDAADGTEDTATTVDVLAGDVWVGSSTPSLTVSTAPAHGTATVGADGIDYTPAAEWSGTDAFAYTLDDGAGHTSTASVTVTVAQVNDARIDTSGDPNMYADEGAVVDDAFTTPDATEYVTWSASGLPVGLSINSSTGEITGRPHYDQAGAHTVSLTATAADGDTDAVALTWNVTDTNRIPWIDDQVTQEGQSANVYFYAVDNFGNQLTYSFSGLPSGTSGPNDTGGHAGDYDVTVSVTGGGATDTRSYHWKIVPAAVAIYPPASPAAGAASFAENGSLVHSDDVGLVGLPMPIQVKLFLTEWDYMHIGNNSLSSIKLEVIAGDAGLTTDPNDTIGSTTIVVTPSQSISATEVEVDAYLDGLAPSASTDDFVVAAFRQVNGGWVQLAGLGKNNFVKNIKVGTGIKLDLSANHARDGIIDADTTPQPMFAAGQYRIPPRFWGWTSLWVTKEGTIGDGKSLYLVAPRGANGQSDNNGRVALRIGPSGNGERWVELTDSSFRDDFAPVGIRGHVDATTGSPYQTAPGHARQIKLGVYTAKGRLDPSGNETDLGAEYFKTLGFSVAAIPVTIRMTYQRSVEGVLAEDMWWWGAKFRIDYVSDSGKTTDLSRVTISEKIVPPNPQPQNVTAHFLENLQVSSFMYVNDPTVLYFDEHSIGQEGRTRAVAAYLVKMAMVELGTGSDVLKQSFEFRDERTSTTPTPPTYIVAHSGFEITYTLDFDRFEVSKSELTITKVAKPENGAEAGEVNGNQPGPIEIK